MKDTKEYQGYTNWATWNVGLWVDNEYPMYKHMQLLCIESADADEFEKHLIEAFLCNPDFKDMELADWPNVNWTELAEHWFAEY